MRLDSDARAIARAGIRAADPFRSTARLLRRDARGVKVAGHLLRVAPGGQVVVVALGKAAGRMARAATRVLGPTTVGIAVTSEGSPRSLGRIRTLVGDHPVPGPRSLAAGRAVCRFLTTRRREDSVLFLISGGGSALVEVPAAPLTLSDLRRTTQILLAAGPPIVVDNAVRTALSVLKGGQLAELVPSRRYATIAISDVVGDPPSVIASGPTVRATGSPRFALESARRYGFFHRLPPRVRERLGALARAPSGPPRRDARRATFAFAATNATAVEGAAREARRRGYTVVRGARPIVGDTRRAALAEARAVVRSPRARPIARISGGETTVVLGPHPGRGGRNQEFALTAARPLAGRSAVVLSIGTDGIDGPTDAAGGWIDGRTVTRAHRLGLDLARELTRHNAYPTLERLGGLLRTGPTGTNVTDLHVALIAARRRGAA